MNIAIELTDNEGVPLGRFAAVTGLWGQGGARPYERRRRLTFEGGVLQGPLLERAGRPARDDCVGHLWVGLLGRAGEVMGRYFFADADLKKMVPAPHLPNAWNVTMTGVLMTPAHPESRRLWGWWAEGRITERNAWAALRPGARRAWLEVARMRSAVAGPKPDAPPGSTFALDGRHVEDQASFLCALGEAINGPGGYFGADFDGFRDCLAGGFGARPPLTLLWNGPSPVGARKRASQAARELDEMLAVLTEAGATIRFGGPAG